ncbi:FAD-binding oxidoreductase [Paracoccus aurantiacus]|uniref:FAD-binding oxidoreductase n=1 Tax=Paracoccus aurantiacus TaxID=2599412 RepID=A0A5C6S7S9_9RHOB|nr:FAD-binding oxidoreductase [Paracoccus aurantiacus]TXB70506.1 FAD-binding oxidoreductase [Paracoccus aurantiacus]
MKTDVIVIGGGIAGISVAARLADAASVTVLESEGRIGTQSSGRSAAIFVMNYGGEAIREVNEAAREFFLNPSEITELPLLAPRGEMMVARAEDFTALDDYLRTARDVEELTTADALALCPILRPEAALRASIERGAQTIDCDLLLNGFAKLLRRRGGTIQHDAPAKAIDRSDGLWQVTTPAGRFSAPVIVNAAGAWADEVAKSAGIGPLGLVPHRRNAAILPAPEHHDIAAWPMVVNASERWYFKPEAGKLMFSPCDAIATQPMDAWSDDMELAEGLDRFSQDVTYEVTRVERSWAGLRTFAPDHVPVIGFDPSAEGFFWLAGQGGIGIQTSPALSELAAAQILGLPLRLSAQTVAALSPARFTPAQP